MLNRIVFRAAVLIVIAAAFALSCGGKSSPTSPAPTLELDSGSIAPGSSYAHTFMNAGVYNYHCTVPGHGAMTGTVTVTSGGSPTNVPVAFGAAIVAIGSQNCSVGSTVTWTNASTTMAHTSTSF